MYLNVNILRKVRNTPTHRKISFKNRGQILIAEMA